MARDVHRNIKIREGMRQMPQELNLKLTTEVKIKTLIYACFCRYVHKMGGNIPDKEQTDNKNTTKKSTEKS